MNGRSWGGWVMPPISLGKAVGRADRPELSDEYRTYLASPAWQATRRAVLVRDGHACTQCGRIDSLEVHHKTYERLGCEWLSDLETLCADCHQGADDARRVAAPKEGARRRTIARRLGR